MSNAVQPQVQTQPLFRLPSGQMYLFLFGQYWPIADMDTLNGVFGGGAVYKDVPSLPVPTNLGPAIANGSCLWQQPGQANVYFVCFGGKQSTAYWITTQDVQAQYQFNGPIQSCSNGALNNLLAALIGFGPNIT